MYFAQLIYSDGPHHAVAIEFAPGVSEQQLEATMAAMEKEARRIFPEQEKTDLLDTSTALGQSITKSGKKFYSAKK
jgi:hypothetical protein